MCEEMGIALRVGSYSFSKGTLQRSFIRLLRRSHIYIYILSVRRNDEKVSFPFLLKRFFSVSLPFLSTVSLPFLLLTVSFPFPPFLFRFFWEYREVFSQLEASPFLYRFFTVSFPFLYRFFSVSLPFLYRFFTVYSPFPLPFLFRFFSKKETEKKRSQRFFWH